MNRVYKQYNWKTLIPEWQASSLSVSDFCKEHDIKSNAMYSALKRRGISSNSSLAENDTDQIFIPIAVSETVNHSSITISIGKANITVGEGFNKYVLQDVLSILSEVC